MTLFFFGFFFVGFQQLSFILISYSTINNWFAIYACFLFFVENGNQEFFKVLDNKGVDGDNNYKAVGNLDGDRWWSLQEVAAVVDDR